VAALMRAPHGAALALAAASAWCAPAAAAHAPALARAARLPTRLPGLAGVALTFDDGPHVRGTPAVLDALATAGATATFFLVGEQVERHPSLAREIVAAGHEVAVHGYRHHCQLRRTPPAVRDDLRRCVDVVASATGSVPRVYRPPYGVFSLGGLLIVRAEALTPLLWSRWARDWRSGETGRSIAKRVTRTIAPGDVVLLHDSDHYAAARSYLRTVAALPAILAALDGAQLAAVPLPHLEGVAA
jgi:peptidoglycan/xylan/chitin deacetylase (PgdA/CDA1 family)